ncbi:MAG: motif [Chlamydiia bacterium]|nr:motif [Chlamydiia bacterium]
MKQNRNEVCSCGSGKKYKKCCGFQAQVKKQLTSSRVRSGFFPGITSGATTKGLAGRIFNVVKPGEQSAPKPIRTITKAPKVDVSDLQAS